MDFGIAFQPGHINLDARIYRLNTYLECGKIKILDCCQHLIDELRDYKFIPQSLDKSNSATDKPEDKNNHAINPLEWIVMELPANPGDLTKGIYNKAGKNLVGEAQRNKKKHYSELALMDDDAYDSYDTDTQGYSGMGKVEYLY